MRTQSTEVGWWEKFNDKAIEGLFAATPPLEALRLLLSWAATAEGKGTSSVAGARGRGARKGILMADVSRAFFDAPARRDGEITGRRGKRRGRRW